MPPAAGEGEGKKERVFDRERSYAFGVKGMPPAAGESYSPQPPLYTSCNYIIKLRISKSTIFILRTNTP